MRRGGGYCTAGRQKYGRVVVGHLTGWHQGHWRFATEKLTIAFALLSRDNDLPWSVVWRPDSSFLRYFAHALYVPFAHCPNVQKYFYARLTWQIFRSRSNESSSFSNWLCPIVLVDFLWTNCDNTEYFWQQIAKYFSLWRKLNVLQSWLCFHWIFQWGSCEWHHYWPSDENLRWQVLAAGWKQW